jgi:hypothetical protein
LLQTKGELQFDRPVTERSNPLFHFVSAPNRHRFSRRLPNRDFTLWSTPVGASTIHPVFTFEFFQRTCCPDRLGSRALAKEPNQGPDTDIIISYFVRFYKDESVHFPFLS